MTWGRALENYLKSKGISKEFDEWIANAKGRSKWRQLAHPIPKPPDAEWLNETSRVNDFNFITQKDTHSVRLILKVTFFCCYMPQWVFFVFLGSINRTRLD